MPALTTVAVAGGLLRVAVEPRGRARVARLVEAPELFAAVPSAVGASRDEALAALQQAVRALDRDAPVRAYRPGSWDLCP